MKNIPVVKLGIVSVSRSCFPITLSASRRQRVVDAYAALGGEIYQCPVTVENESDALRAADDVKEAGVNALVIYLGNFGPESSETILAQLFGGPVMYAAAAEEDKDNLIDGRGDAYCGMLNCSYNLGLRGIRAYIPEYPVGSAQEVAQMIREFRPVAAGILGLRGLKLMTFGPRPQDFMACNGPIQPLFDLGVEIEENSELDLLVAYRKHDQDSRIPRLVCQMARELGEGNRMADVLPRLAQYEITLLDWAEEHRGSRSYVAFANKCWPAFQTEFGFVPCYVNARLGAMGIPVACEVDIYGALSEYLGLCLTGEPVTLLDINNTVPENLYQQEIASRGGRNLPRLNETFMGFHCGNTPICRLRNPVMGYQLIMKRDLEPDSPPNITRGTLEGTIQAGPVTFYRLQGTARGELKAYVAQGEVLPTEPGTFGGVGVFSIPEMNRFYRHVLIEKHYPHHGAVAFGHQGKALFSLFRYLAIGDISYNQPASLPYPTENPF